MNRAHSTLRSIFTISSRNKESHSQSFGTAFLLHKDSSHSYLVTCSHVVESIGGYENILVQSKQAEVIASGTEYGLDLSILKVANLDSGQPLQLYNSGKENDRIVILGTKQIHKNPAGYSIDPARGQLSDLTALQSRISSEFFKGWLFALDSDCFISGGYSGAPVIHESSSYVLAIVSQAQGTGNKGRAIAVSSIDFLWKQIPAKEFPNGIPDLFKDNLKSHFGIDYSPLRDLLANRQWELADQVTGYLMYKAVGGWNALQLRAFEKAVEASFDMNQQHLIPSVEQYIDKSPRLKSILERMAGQETEHARDKLAKENRERYKLAGIAGFVWLPFSIRKINSFPLIDLDTIDCLWTKYSDGRYGFSNQNRIWIDISNSNRVARDAAWVFCDRVGWKYSFGRVAANLFPTGFFTSVTALHSTPYDSKQAAGIKVDPSRPSNALEGTYPCRVLTSCVNTRYKVGLTVPRNVHATCLAKALSTLSTRLESTRIS